MSEQSNSSPSWKSLWLPILLPIIAAIAIQSVAIIYHIGQLSDKVDNLEVRMTAIEVKVGDLGERVARIEGLLQGWQTRPVEISQKPAKP